jgi:hypothetical protein
MAATNTIAILMILLSLPWSVTDALNPRLHQPELAAGDSQRQHHLLLGPFSLRPSLNVAPLNERDAALLFDLAADRFKLRSLNRTS